MGDAVIEVRDLAKRYRIGGAGTRYKSLRDSLANAARRAFRRDGPDAEQDIVWALRGVSFDVRGGEVLGIVGRNGAGKTTLLKILSRITEPTEGEARVRGRVGSLLEVGTGFHPELTGRENISLNAAILGMRRAEIDRRFDEIVSFAGTERFLDTPVKHYSSGMQMRLAFAVAAHLDSEILLVDEVLAVGDLEFQRKCLGKMQDVSRSGRTVLFVSHNLQAVKLLCNRAMLLEEGRIARDADVESVLGAYLAAVAMRGVGGEIKPSQHLVPPMNFEIVRVELLNRWDEPVASLLMDETFTIRVWFRVHDSSQEYRMGLWLRTADGLRLAAFVSTDDGRSHFRGEQGVLYQAALTTQNVFPPGEYAIDVNAKSAFDEYADQIEGIRFTVDPVSVTDAPQSARRSEGRVWGLVRLPGRWTQPVVAHEPLRARWER